MLTSIFVNVILNDKKSCQNDKNTSHVQKTIKEKTNKRKETKETKETKEREGRNMNAVGESPEGTKSQAWNQSGTDGEACRSIPTDHQPDRKRRLFPIGNTCPEAGTDLSGSGGGYIQLFGG